MVTNGDAGLSVLQEEPQTELREGADRNGVHQRRTKLPCPVPDMADFSLWSILRKNIGTASGHV